MTDLPDPLLRLGPDVFVDVLAQLDVTDLLSAELVSKAWRACAAEHASRLWRALAYRTGVEQADLEAGDGLAATGTYPLPEYDMRPIATDRAQLYPDDRVNWRYVVRAHHAQLDAWSRAHARVEWVTPYPNIAWRIKSDAAAGVLLSTSRMSGPLNEDIDAPGLLVVDRRTSERLWSIPTLQGYSHLEAGAGFFAFNRARDDAAFEVWRNAEARRRSSLPKQGESQFAGESHTHPDYDPSDPNSPLPRGHYEHFLTLRPPTAGRAYRMHIDHEGTPGAAAVLATCATAAIYIWHLEEDVEMETIERGPDDQGSPNYIELDDDYVFVCDDWQMHVYVRETRAHIVSFPPLRGPPSGIARLGFPLSITEDFKAIPDAERVRGAAPVGRAHAHAVFSGEAAFQDVIERSIAMLPAEDRTDGTMYAFSACHYTSRDLVCTTEAGGVLFVRNYADVFAQCARMEELEPPLIDDPQRHVAAAERAKYVADHSIIIGLGTTVKQLTTYRDHIVFVTSFNVLLLDGRKIPDIPERAESLDTSTDSSLVKDEDEERKADADPVSSYQRAAGAVADAEERALDDPVMAEGEKDEEEQARGASTPADTAMAVDLDSISELDWPDTDSELPETEEAHLLPRRTTDRTRVDARDIARPTLRAHVLPGNHQQSMKLSSCLQADARSIYLTYWAAGEWGDSESAITPTLAARDGLGLCVKAWTFGPDGV